jgi:uncharacterized protein YdiU (UPF0061 family)
MAALGVPTTRALAAVTTGEIVSRDEPLPGAVLTRVAASHLRVGTFELLAARRDDEGLKALTHYALARHYPAAVGAPNEALALLEHVIGAQARLVAAWLGLGFIHGVMNTDNTSISGETIDYGPCAFLDVYDPNKKFSSIDRGGRYAFANQPRIAQWNLTRLAETLLPQLSTSDDEAVEVATKALGTFSDAFEAAQGRVMRAKLGFAREEDDDLPLMADLLERMASNEVDFTLFFRQLCASADDSANDAKTAKLFDTPMAFHEWAERWRARLARETTTSGERAAAMRAHNPAFIPRNHRVEELIQAAVRRGDFTPFHTMVKTLSRPYDDQPEVAYLAESPKPEERVRATFCGT